jgi:hypothetical protein
MSVSVHTRRIHGATAGAWATLFACAWCASARAQDEGALAVAQPTARAEPIHTHSALPDWAELCETDIRIAGALFNAQHPARSQVMLRPAPGQRSGVYRPGMTINQFQLLAIEPRAVLLSHGGEACWLRMVPADHGRAPSKPAPSQDKPEREKRGAAFSERELAEGIEQLGPSSFRVRRAFLQEALGRGPGLARSARIRTVGPSDAPSGLQLRRLDRGGLFKKLGLERKDVLQTINGLSLTTPEGVLGARALLTTAERFSLTLERDGQRRTLDYVVE